MNKKKIVRSIGALFMAMCMIISLMPAPFLADKTVREIPEDAIYISTPDDVLELAEKCKVNTWSIDKTVVLDNDIDMSKHVFNGIPTFGGVFIGKGFTIKGMNMKAEGSVVGFFRYLQKTAIVENVNFEGNILPSGSASIVGAIAGKNAGEIHNCTFKGNLSGNEQIGGLVGVNETTGLVEDCTIAGMVYGNHFVGGAVGENHGVIRNTVNYAEMNTLSVQNSVALEDITMDSLMNTENASTTTDIGGIAGTNTGVIRSCQNHGIVGYQSMGYNIGGIAGRQSGYIVDCINYATVQGRKEIGGIAGHVEPNIVLSFNEDGIEKLQEQLNVLEGSVNNLKANVKNEGENFQNQMNQVETELKSVQDAVTALGETLSSGDVEKSMEEAAKLLKSITAHLNNIMSLLEQLSASMDGLDEGTLGELNAIIAQIQTSINNISVAIESLNPEALVSIIAELNAITKSISELIDKLELLSSEEGTTDNDSINQFNALINSLKADIKKLEEALTGLQTATNTAVETLSSISKRLTNISNIIQQMSNLLGNSDSNSNEELKSILTQLQASLDIINAALENPNAESIAKAVQELSKLTQLLNELMDKLEKGEINNQTEAWTALVKSFNDEVAGLQGDITKLENALKGLDVSAAIETLSNISKTLDELSKLLENMQFGMDEETKQEITKILSQIKTSIDNITKALDSLDLEALGTIVAELNTLMSSLNDLAAKIAEIYSDVQDTTNGWKGILDQLKTEMSGLTDDINKLEKILNNLEVDKPEAAVNDASSSIGNLFNLLGNMSNSMDASAQNVTDAINDVINKLDAVMGVVDNMDESIKATIEDISDLDQIDNTLGKIARCQNYADVTGDYNIGGIVGLMGEEADFSTAENAEVLGTVSLNAAYQMRAVVRGCKNEGKIAATKQNVGGIVGQMMLGCILESTNLGNIDALSADYVGGIVGNSDTIIRNCSTKSVIAGDTYVGGIAGTANEVTNCYAFVQIAVATEKAGAILGDAKELPAGEDAVILGNLFFVAGEEFGGIDGISYTGATDCLKLEEFLKIPDLDKAFKKAKIKFRAEGQSDVEKSITVGESLSLDQIPNVTVEEGEEADWKLVPAVTSEVLGMGEIADITYISEESLSNILFDQVYEVSFDTKGSVVSALDRTENNKSILLAVGSFAKNTTIDMQDMLDSEARINGKAAIVNYQVSLSNSGIKNLHFLLPENVEADGVKLLVKDASGKWSEREFAVEGSYIVFAFAEGETGFALVKDTASMMGDIGMVVVIVVVVILVLIILGKMRKKSKKK